MSRRLGDIWRHSRLLRSWGVNGHQSMLRLRRTTARAGRSVSTGRNGSPKSRASSRLRRASASRRTAGQGFGIERDATFPAVPPCHNFEIEAIRRAMMLAEIVTAMRRVDKIGAFARVSGRTLETKGGALQPFAQLCALMVFAKHSDTVTSFPAYQGGLLPGGRT